ncbi:MAG TPA: NADH-quinone oxidoreductase subunit C [Kouleothrix sp.]|jgi:NADH-quinone oxidoreductase subunit C|uniref:NADH-quinone oxidoreductase subunit C n=1 Tax=Kouleothrix sp. TaxID=2779161 RepID=UPI002B9F94F4|nr:NADH-quinone oxidoreductase subunit C [Kouleothrix sp.]HRC74916.1 NADH-quinone oxidoreductase subunit C [Kouleothrix sp.]
MDNATVIERLRAALPNAIERTAEYRGDLSIYVRRDAIVDVARALRDDSVLRYNFLENLCGVDYLGRTPRFEVVYHLLSYSNRHRVCLKVGANDGEAVPTLIGLWATANWQERETYDLLGIPFSGHPGLQRILMPDDWQGHPQRKDVPLGGEEVAFSFNQDQIYAHKPFAKE